MAFVWERFVSTAGARARGNRYKSLKIDVAYGWLLTTVWTAVWTDSALGRAKMTTFLFLIGTQICFLARASSAVPLTNICTTITLKAPQNHAYDGTYRITSATLGKDGRPTYKCVHCVPSAKGYLYFSQKYKFWALGPGNQPPTTGRRYLLSWSIACAVVGGAEVYMVLKSTG
jgi:hypothetical protein